MRPGDLNRVGVSWWALFAGILLLLQGCFGRKLHEGKHTYEIYADGDIDPEWSDWSFGYLDKKKGQSYQQGNSTLNSRKAYCIDIQQQYGAASFAAMKKIVIDNSTILDISLRRNGTLEGPPDELSRLQLVLEGVSKDISFMTDPITMLEIIGDGPGSEEIVEKFFNGEYIELSVKARDLIQGVSPDGQVDFSQISIGSCLTQDPACLSSKKDSIISFCIGAISLV